MSGELVLYTNPMSRGRMARIMLEEIGVRYRAEIVAYGPQMKGEAYRAVNPMGKVPALVHGDAVVTECGAICTYLADAFPEAGLAPEPGDPLRGPYLRWMFFGAGPVDTAATMRSLGYVPPPEAAGRVGWGSIELVTDVLEQAVAGRDWLLGERFSAADVYLGSQITWGIMFGTIDKRPALEAYAARLMARPAVQRANAIDDALMPPSAA